MTDCWKEVSPDLSQQRQCGTNNIRVHDRKQYRIVLAYHSINQTIESPYYKCDVFSPDTTSIISVGCYLWWLLTAFHQTSRQLVTSRSQSRLGLGRGLVHIPATRNSHAIWDHTAEMTFPPLPQQSRHSIVGQFEWICWHDVCYGCVHMCVWVSVTNNSVFYRNGGTDRASSGQRSYHRLFISVLPPGELLWVHALFAWSISGHYMQTWRHS